MSIERLITAAERTAQTVDVLGYQFALELAAVLRSLERKLRPLVADVAEGSRTAIVKAGLANRTRKELERQLTRAGYDYLAQSAYGKRLDPIVANVLETRRLAQQTARLSGAFNARVQALKTLHETDLLDEGAELARALWQAVTRGVFGARSINDILDDLSAVIDATEPQLRTLYDTSVSIFSRQIEALQAGDEPDTPFLFVGPADDKTREFCRAHVGKVYTREQINAMDNGQIDNCFLSAGGFNCRHQWIEVSKFSELYEYIGTDKRAPEIQRLLDDRAAA